MRTRTVGRGALAALCVALVVLLATGCASYYLRQGDAAAAKGDWDRAVGAYRSATGSDPDNLEARSKLAHATQQAASAHRAQADRLVAQGDLAEAIAEFKRSLGYVADPSTEQLLARTIRQKNRADAQALIARASGEESRGDLVAAQRSYERAITLDPDRADAHKALGRVSDRIQRARSISERAQQALTASRLQTAERLARQAKEIHPKDGVAERVLDEVAAEREARAQDRRAEDASRAGRVDEAVLAASNATRVRPTGERVSRLDGLKRDAARHHRLAGDAAFAARLWDDAIASYERSRDYSGGDLGLASKLRDARHEREVARALQAQARGNLDAAVEHYRRANDIKPDPEIQARAAALGNRPLTGEELYEKRRDSVVMVRTNASLGSGVVVADGIVLTNRHVLSGPTGLLITPAGQQVPYYRAVQHRYADIAVIYVTGLVAEPAPLGDGLKLKPGERVFVIGNPRGLGWSFSEGSVSYVGRSVGTEQLIQFTAPISPGSSGGPVFDEAGKVVGLATSQLRDAQNLNFAVPIEYGEELIEP